MSDPGTLVIRRLIRASREEIFAMWTEIVDKLAAQGGPFRAATLG